MTQRLYHNFTGSIGWVFGCWLVIVSMTIAKPMQADTCQHPQPPILTGSASSVCRGESVTLSATGCTGTVVWSTGETGSVIQVSPAQTTTYTAICRLRPGCISCFADPFVVSVKTPSAPVVSTAVNRLCPGDAATLTATDCSGTVRWVDHTGTILGEGIRHTNRLRQTTTFWAVCVQNQCESSPSKAIVVEMVEPTTPILTADRTDVCQGQTVRLVASGCVGVVRWSDGQSGVVRLVNPALTTTYRAICEVGTCQSDSAAAIRVQVQSVGQPSPRATLTNGCPFMTADLTQTISEREAADPTSRYMFCTGPLPNSPTVQSPVAVQSGTYYIFRRDSMGCYSRPVIVSVVITSCEQPIAPCLSSPPTVQVRIDSLNWAKGVVWLRGRLGGSAQNAVWQSSGDGLFTDTSLDTRYLLSEADRQRERVTFTLQVPDPDDSGPCSGASAQLAASSLPHEQIGLSKQVSEPVWLVNGGRRLAELTYQLTMTNSGKSTLNNLQLSDNLDAVFSATGASVDRANVHADDGVWLNPAYTGHGADTTLLQPDQTLVAGASVRLWLTVRVDVSRANTLTFVNQATVEATGNTGAVYRDQSTNGLTADPNQNNDPTDDQEPTVVVLQIPPSGQEVTDLFIPEGFSPNGDGVNDRFVIQRIPVGVTVRFDVYNRWGHVVYHQDTYQNDWDGTANQGISADKQSLPDGTYYYQIRLSNGQEYTRFLTLKR